jgi:hypothetical protein
MRNMNPQVIFGIGFALLLVGLILPMLMVIHILESTYLLNFVAYASSFSGLMLGIIGSVSYTIRHRKK